MFSEEGESSITPRQEVHGLPDETTSQSAAMSSPLVRMTNGEPQAMFSREEGSSTTPLKVHGMPDEITPQSRAMPLTQVVHTADSAGPLSLWLPPNRESQTRSLGEREPFYTPPQEVHKMLDESTPQSGAIPLGPVPTANPPRAPPPDPAPHHSPILPRPPGGSGGGNSSHTSETGNTNTGFTTLDKGKH